MKEIKGEFIGLFQDEIFKELNLQELIYRI